MRLHVEPLTLVIGFLIAMLMALGAILWAVWQVGKVSPARLLAAYRRGIFPWFSTGQPILWWSPDPRAVLFPQEFHQSRSLRRRLRTGGFETRLDTRFAAVIEESRTAIQRSPNSALRSPIRASSS